MLQLGIIFLLNLITSTMAQLKYVLATKQHDWKMYALIGIDSVFYLYSLTLVMGDTNSTIGIIMMTAGKLLGVTLANFLNDKLIEKIYIYTLYFTNVEIVDELETFAFDNNISITTMTGRANKLTRYVVTMHLTNKNSKLLFDFLKEKGIDKPTGDRTEASRVFGHIRSRLKETL